MAGRAAKSAMRQTGAAIVAAALLVSGQACAQSAPGNGPLNFLGNLFTGSKGNQAAPTQPGDPAPSAPGSTSSAALPWSGEDGASGHPLMTASAIREAAANFDTCVASMWPDAARRNIPQANFERFTMGLSPDLRIMDLLDAQPEFTKSIWDYLDILVNDDRLAKGREILAKYKAQFDAAEKAYGVDPLCDRGDLGHRIQLLDPDGRPQRLEFHRDARLRRPPPGLFQG